jgi:tRNA U34 5-methylaminomethyl-2-thiouridine-forming methyltransferase MnmC
LDYCQQLDASNNREAFQRMHGSPWEETTSITPDFSLLKQKKDFKEIEEENLFNLIYFDAFGARVQPELWTEEIFLKMYHALEKGGVLVTYAAKGSVRRAMQAVGFTVERLPGPPGKREMLRAIKS